LIIVIKWVFLIATEFSHPILPALQNVGWLNNMIFKLVCRVTLWKETWCQTNWFPIVFIGRNVWRRFIDLVMMHGTFDDNELK
jgi:hypothetical protein